jgi:hypothetical protein
MIDRLEFYHGAAIIKVIEDSRCQSIGKSQWGYVVNNDKLAFIKYSTKAHSPWRFTMTPDDLRRLALGAAQFQKCVIGFVCGGDGVCPVEWSALKELISTAPSWVSTTRRFNGWYSLAGQRGTLERKVALNEWPAILFEEG